MHNVEKKGPNLKLEKIRLYDITHANAFNTIDNNYYF